MIISSRTVYTSFLFYLLVITTCHKYNKTSFKLRAELYFFETKQFILEAKSPQITARDDGAKD